MSDSTDTKDGKVVDEGKALKREASADEANSTDDEDRAKKKIKSEKSSSQIDKKASVSSFQVFNEFVKKSKNGEYDASEVLSYKCFLRWLETRQKAPKMPEESFRRAITAHVRGADGRRPFSEAVEMALLKELRKKGAWKCFGKSSTIGKLGYQKLGYHEERSVSSKSSKDKKEARNTVPDARPAGYPPHPYGQIVNDIVPVSNAKEFVPSYMPHPGMGFDPRYQAGFGFPPTNPGNITYQTSLPLNGPVVKQGGDAMYYQTMPMMPQALPVNQHFNTSNLYYTMPNMNGARGFM